MKKVLRKMLMLMVLCGILGACNQTNVNNENEIIEKNEQGNDIVISNSKDEGEDAVILKPRYTSKKTFKNYEEMENYFYSEESIGVDSELERFVLLGDAVVSGGIYEFSSTSTYKDMPKYSAANLLSIITDNNWAEGVEGYGIGEKITIKMSDCCEKLAWGEYTDFNIDEITPEEVGPMMVEYIKERAKVNSRSELSTDGNVENYYNYIDGVYIINGFAKDSELWKKNSRVKKLKMIIDNKEEYILELDDNDKVQAFDVKYNNGDISKPIIATFEILEVYEGDEYKDTVLTLLRPYVTSNMGWGGR